MPRKDPTRALISAVMAELGKRGGKAGKGDSKRRGGDTAGERRAYYQRIVAMRKDRKGKPRKQRRRLPL